MSKSIFILLLPLIALSCITAEKAYNKGNHKEAVLLAIKQLGKKPSDNKAKNILKNAYPLYIENQFAHINRLENSSNPLKWETIQEEYKDMEKVYTKIRSVPAARRILPQAVSYAPKIAAIESKILTDRYDLGMELLELGDRENAMKAYQHFSFILNRTSSFKDTHLKTQEAKDLATLYVGIAPIPPTRFRYEANLAAFENELTVRLIEENRNEFIQFVPPSDRNFPEEAFDHIIQMRFDDFSIGNTRDQERIYDRQKENVDTKEVSVGDSTIITSVTAKATVHCFNRTIISSGVLSLQIVDQDRHWIESERFEGTHEYYTQWGYFEGDSRALSSEDNQCLAQRSPPIPPRNEELFTEFTVPIFEDVTDFLRNFYRNY